MALAKLLSILKLVREKDSIKYRLESDFVEYLCVPLTSVALSFIVVCLINGQ